MDAALGRFKPGSLNFQTLTSELVAASEAECQQLEEARRQLDEEVGVARSPRGGEAGDASSEGIGNVERLRGSKP